MLAGVFAATVLLGSDPGLADAVEDCAGLAGHLIELERLEADTDGGVPASGALAACAQAVEIAPNDPRMALLYGLTLMACGQDQEGLAQLRRSADRGYTTAEFFLGSFYFGLHDAGSDNTRARQLFRKAAAQGHRGAQLFLALMYQNGLGGDRNLEQAAYWFSKAADQGHPIAKYILGVMYQSGDGVPQDIEMSLALIREAAELEQREAQFSLGLVYLDGWYGIEPDGPRAISLLEDSARQGSILAMAELGEIYIDGTHVPRDVERGERWFCAAGSFGRGQHENLYGESLSCVDYGRLLAHPPKMETVIRRLLILIHGAMNEEADACG